MKYLKYEYWVNINSCNPKICYESNIQWEQAACDYSLYFNKVCEKLPEKFFMVYKNNSGFHDMLLNEYNFNNNSKFAIIKFISHKKKISIGLKNVSKFQFYNFQYNQFNISIKTDIFNNKLYCGYTEFELLKNCWEWRILFDNGMELHIRTDDFQIL